MAGRRPLAAFIALALTLALILPSAMGPAMAAGQSQDTVRLPADIPINTDGKLDVFEQDGVVSASVGAPQMDMTIADDRDSVGANFTLNPLKGDTRNDFIRLDHREDMARTVKIPIRAEYWKPFPREGLQSLDESHTADLTPVDIDGREYTMLTVTFTGADSAVFPVPEDAVAVYSAAERTENRTKNLFGIHLGVTPTPWSTIEPDVFSANDTTVRIEGNPETMMIQYNAGTPEDPVWLPVPDGQRRNVPVFAMQQDGVTDAVYVVSATNESIALRYKTQSTWGDKMGAWTRSARNLPHNIADGFGRELPEIDLPFVGDDTEGEPGVSA